MPLKAPFFILFLLFGIVGSSQEQTLRSGLEQYTQSLIENDFDRMISLTPESIVKMSGGAFYVKEEFRNDFEIRESQNIEYLDYKTSETSEIIFNQGQLQTIQEVQMLTSFSGKKFICYIQILALSDDRGASWSFINLEKHDPESIQTFIPQLSSELSFPEVKEATLFDKSEWK